MSDNSFNLFSGALPGNYWPIVVTVAATGAMPNNGLNTVEIIRANATGGSITLTLPAASGVSGKIYLVARISTGLNTVTINGTGGDLLSGAASVLLGAVFGKSMLVSTGTEWIAMI